MEYIFVPLSDFLSLPPSLLIGIIEIIFSRAAHFLCQTHLFFHFQLKTHSPVLFSRSHVCECVSAQSGTNDKTSVVFSLRLFVEAAVF